MSDRIVAPGSSGVALTDREEQVASLLSMGWSHKKIGSRLGISTNNVSVHVKKIAGRIRGNGKNSIRVAVWYLTYRDSET